MSFYLRKSVTIGPVRFNLSKSGIGLSSGIKGFRIGVRPNGKSYVHAGRNGIYYRQELGKSDKENSKIEITKKQQDINPNTTFYKSASSIDIASESRRELLEKLNSSHKSLRRDYIIGVLLLLVIGFSFRVNSQYGLVAILVGWVLFIISYYAEKKRRTVEIEYNFENGDADYYRDVLLAFNNLESCKKVWALLDSTAIYGAHEQKRNSGASELVSRSLVKLGEGKPPWVRTNIDVPALILKDQSLYLMPDGIFIYDNVGVGFVEYSELSLEDGTTEFIEEVYPNDATVLGTSWKYSNKSGGPDKRFKNNYEVYICLYGNLMVKSASGLFWYLMTSKENAALEFCNALSRAVSHRQD
ncbi:DUF4236 domain-containing protein [Maridesulfovibrio frigidus]|uniref:DUF4236 domain-containing protein n=1 Tax=Maridesulfovibrio frigidus TaxID=340956 RepID=UPI0004E1BFC7|nr:DUF4236 domain-containing protein [Maridesulfovibrio frigidus]